MKRFLPWISLILLTIMVLLPAGIALATYDSVLTVTVFNNGTDWYSSGIPILLPINNSQLVTYDHINASANDTNALEGSLERNYLPVSNYVGVFFPTFLPGQSRDVSYRLGEVPVQTNFSIITGLGGNLTVSDDPSMELGNNGTIILYGVYLDPAQGSESAYLIYKDSALEVFHNGTHVVAVLLSGTATATATLRPDGVGVYSNWSHTTGTPHWAEVDDSSPDEDTTRVYQLYSSGHGGGLYNVTAPGFLGTNQSTFTVNQVYRARGDSGGFAGYGVPQIYLGGTTVKGGQDSYDTSYANYGENYTAARPGGGTWVSSDFDNIQVGLIQYAVAGGYAHCTQMYLSVGYTYWNETYTAVPYTTGEYDIIVSANTTDLSLDLSGTATSTTLLQAMANNANDWFFLGDNSSYYASSISLAVNGTTVSTWQPTSLISSSTLPDSVGSNDATINWGTNPPAFEFTVGAITSEETGTASGGGSTYEVPDILPTPPTFDYYPEEDPTLTGMPMYTSVAAQAASMGMSVKVAYTLWIELSAMAFGVACFLAMSTGWGFVGGFLAINVLAAGTPVNPIFFIVVTGMILVLGLFLWRQT